MQDPQVNFLAAQEGPHCRMPSLSHLTTATVVIQDLDDEKADDNKVPKTEGKNASTSIGLTKGEVLPVLATMGYHFEDTSATSSEQVSLKSSSLLSPSPDDEGKKDSTLDTISLNETLPPTTASPCDFAKKTQATEASTLHPPGPGLSQAFAINTPALPLNNQTMEGMKDDRCACNFYFAALFAQIQDPRQHRDQGRIFGGCAQSDWSPLDGTHATWRFPLIVKSIMNIAFTRLNGFENEPFLSAQLNAANCLPTHKGINNDGKSWLIAIGDYEGGRLWLESPVDCNHLLVQNPTGRGSLDENLAFQNTWVCFGPFVFTA